MAKNATYSIVIPSYNEEKLLPQCLNSLVKQKTSHEFEVIVVDNNSTDKTAEIARSYNKKLDLKVISEKKKGRGPARHAGFVKARGNIILSTDADTVLPTNWVETTAIAFEKNKNIVATTNPCKINDCSWLKNHTFNFLMPKGMKIYRLIFGHYWLSGFGFAIKKEIYKKSGGFDTKLNAMEDIEFSFRVKEYGKIVLLRHSRPIFSGRRFQKSLIGGVWEYAKPFFKYIFLKKKSLYLSDVRK